MILNSSEIKNIPLCYYLINWICLFDAFSVKLSTCFIARQSVFNKANYRYNYILGNDHSFFYFNYPDLSPFYDI